MHLRDRLQDWDLSKAWRKPEAPGGVLRDPRAETATLVRPGSHCFALRTLSALARWQGRRSRNNHPTRAPSPFLGRTLPCGDGREEKEGASPSEFSNDDSRTQKSRKKNLQESAHEAARWCGNNEIISLRQFVKFLGIQV